MKIFFNRKMNFNDEKIWNASNGKTRRNLVVINKIGNIDETNFINADVGFLNKGNHSFIFLNKEKTNNNKILGIYINGSYGYKVLEGKTIFENNSVGGYGNSESKFGIYEIGTLIEVNTYKNRQSPTYYKLNENGWNEIGIEEVGKNDIVYIS